MTNYCVSEWRNNVMDSYKIKRKSSKSDLFPVKLICLSYHALGILDCQKRISLHLRGRSMVPSFSNHEHAYELYDLKHLQLVSKQAFSL